MNDIKIADAKSNDTISITIKTSWGEFGTQIYVGEGNTFSDIERVLLESVENMWRACLPSVIPPTGYRVGRTKVSEKMINPTPTLSKQDNNTHD